MWSVDWLFWWNEPWFGWRFLSRQWIQTGYQFNLHALTEIQHFCVLWVGPVRIMNYAYGERCVDGPYPESMEVRHFDA